jgi:hypothetical protein
MESDQVGSIREQMIHLALGNLADLMNRLDALNVELPETISASHDGVKRSVDEAIFEIKSALKVESLIHEKLVNDSRKIEQGIYRTKTDLSNDVKASLAEVTLINRQGALSSLVSNFILFSGSAGLGFLLGQATSVTELAGWREILLNKYLWGLIFTAMLAGWGGFSIAIHCIKNSKE